MDSTQIKRISRQFAIAFAIWTLLGCLQGINVYVMLKARSEFAATYNIFRDALGFHWLWALATLPIFAFSARFPLQRPGLLRNIAAHLGFFSVIAVSYAGMADLLGLWVQPPLVPFSGSPLAYRLITSAFGYLWMYAVITAAWHLGDFYRKFREREMRAAKLQAELATAQLELLKAQIHPHFLFNTLNSISALMQEDVQAADDMLADLSFMLRASLEASSNQEIDLESEIDLLATYLRIQKRRFEDRLSVELQIAPDTLDARVPSLLLQPFVENSIRHGIVPQSRPGKVVVSSLRRGDQMVLQIADNGTGLRADYKEGIGLSNTRARLKRQYGEEQSVRLVNNLDGGVTVTITLPFRKMDEEIVSEGQAYELQNTGS